MFLYVIFELNFKKMPSFYQPRDLVELIEINYIPGLENTQGIY
jgi:hypothetical protein